MAGLFFKEGVAGGNSVADGLMTRSGPMEDGVKVCEGKSVTLRTWKRVARQSQKANVDKQPSSMDRRPEMDCIKVESNKK